jgi:uncharacterized protein YceK
MMHRFPLLILLAFAFLLGGCATTSDKDKEEEKVSTIPWNKPQKWEKKGPIGGGGARY